MKDYADVFVYMMANEKLIAMMSLIEQNLEFFKEYGVKPDEDVRKVLLPLIEQLKKWCNDGQRQVG